MDESVLDRILLLPDETLHAAFLEVNSRTLPRLCPELKLVRSIFLDAIETFCELTVSQTQLHRLEESREWIFDTENKGWIFSFESVCDMLDYDPSYWRRLCRDYEIRAPAYTVRKRGRPAKNKAFLDEHGD